MPRLRSSRHIAILDGVCGRCGVVVPFRVRPPRNPLRITSRAGSCVLCGCQAVIPVTAGEA
jgi:hypothetical protein